MSDKAKKLSQLLGKVKIDWKPTEDLKEANLLEVGLYCVLSRQLTESQAQATLKALGKEYPDWNELRVSQVQEFQGLVKSKSHDVQLAVARAVKEYLQEVFQKNHGFDIEFLSQDFVEAGKFMAQLEFLGQSAGHYLLLRANPEEMPVTMGVIRVMDRLGLMKRTSSIRKAQAALEPLVPAGKRTDFAVRIGQVAGEWCDSKKPRCWECPLLDACPHGAKVHREWKVQQQRLEAQRKKEEERRRKEEERERKRAEAEARRRTKELAKKKAQGLKRKQQEEAKREREAARKKREAAREAKRKADAKKAAKRAAKKAAKKKVTKKPAAKKATKKKAAKKTTTSKKATKKKTTTKKGTKKPVTKKKTTKKKVTKRPVAKKKPVTKKKKKVTKKPATKRKTKRGARR